MHNKSRSNLSSLFRAAVLCAIAVIAGVMGCLQAAPAVTGSFASIPSGSVVDLTEQGQLDWVHWGLYTETSINRKASVFPQLSDFTPVDNPNGFVFIYQFADNTNGYSWADGTPVTNVTNTLTGVWAFGTPLLGSGFKISAPADTNPRTLKVYVGAFKARGRLEAYLSDGSAHGYTNSSLFNTGNGPSGVYTISYEAGSAGQTLTIRWTLAMPSGPDANVTLQAAALTSSSANNPPFVAMEAPANNATFAEGATINLRATANDLDGSISSVEFFQGDTKLGEDQDAPYEFSWNNVSAGAYQLLVQTTDQEGATSMGTPVEIFVHGPGGSLAGNRALPPTLPAVINLTTEGTRDWIHWGLGTNHLMDRKAGVVPQLTEFTKLGSNEVNRYDNNYSGFIWSDGAPTANAAGTTTGVFTYGLHDGFELSVPADTASRTLKVYVGLYGAQGQLQAWLSDFSAPAYTDSTFSNRGNSYAVYQLNYRAASANQRLIVRYSSLTLLDSDFGNVTLQAATLVAGDTAVPVTLFGASKTDAGFRCSFATEAGRSYTVQYSDALFSEPWQVLTNVSGTGADALVADPGPLAPRFYRVRTP